MPNWDHICPECGERGSYLDFPATDVPGHIKCPDPQCGYTDVKEAFFDPTYY